MREGREGREGGEGRGEGEGVHQHYIEWLGLWDTNIREERGGERRGMGERYLESTGGATANKATWNGSTFPVKKHERRLAVVING